MAVYIDNMNAKYSRMIMCHMMADTKEELIQMAVSIGLSTRWIQHEDTYKEHFDVSKSVKKLAIQNGAIEVTSRDLGMLMRKRKGKSYDRECITC